MVNMDINEKIKTFGEALKNRLDSSLIDFALEYIDFSENVLAFETLCGHIANYQVRISPDEYRQVLDIAGLLEIDNQYTEIDPLRNLLN